MILGLVTWDPGIGDLGSLAWKPGILDLDTWHPGPGMLSSSQFFKLWHRAGRPAFSCAVFLENFNPRGPPRVFLCRVS